MGVLVTMSLAVGLITPPLGHPSFDGSIWGYSRRSLYGNPFGLRSCTYKSLYGC